MVFPFTFAKKPTPLITFRCAPEDEGIIAPPVAAKTVLPDWFRKLPPSDPERVSATDNGLTIKRCMPFLDAMTTGWILPVAATVRLEISDGGRTVNAGWEFDKVMVSNHHPYQIAGNPHEPRPPCKLHNYWTIATPPGWSCLFVSPLNRNQPVIELLAGVVDTDSYQSLIHFPFIPKAEDGVYTLEKGTPLAQVIPFRRDAATIDCEIRAETDAEVAARTKILRHTQAAEGWYRKEARAKR
ncbi:MAG: DUF6065 family protein [Beijerinckiaceae bacterium]